MYSIRALLSLALAALIAEPCQAQATLAVPAASSADLVKAGPYAWPSPTVSNPYPTISLPNSGAPPACASHEDTNGDLLKGDSLLDWSPWGFGCGWFGALEIDPVGPSIKNRLNAPVMVGGATTILQLPSADLHWTVMPNVEMGYRLGQGAGALLVSYRGLSAAGSGALSGFDAAGNAAPLSTHLNLHVVDFDYASRENALGPLWDMKWRAGIRIANVFFDSTAGTPLLSQHESNNFAGAGPHFALELKRRLGDGGLSILGKLDGGVVLGRVHQLYEEAIPGVGSASTTASANEPAPVLEVRFGLDYAPAELPNIHLATGYLFQRWWTVGETAGTQGEVTYQGIFCRAEWRY